MYNHIVASERYMRLALKARANSRATMEVMAKLHRPRKQIVRHVHANDGGQAIVARHVNHFSGGVENGRAYKRSHAAAAVTGGCFKLSCEDEDVE